MYIIEVESGSSGALSGSQGDLKEWLRLAGRAPQLQATTTSGSASSIPLSTSNMLSSTANSVSDDLSSSTIGPGTVSASVSAVALPSSTSVDAAGSTTPDNSSKVKSTLEYIFLSVALLVFGLLVLRRLRDLRRRGLPLSAFFAFMRSPVQEHETINTIRSFPRTTGLPHIVLQNGYPIYPHDAVIIAPPIAYTPNRRGRRTHAADIDVGGRRTAGINGELDHDGPLSDKDVLPAYETFGGPPKYDDLGIPRNPLPRFDTTHSDSNLTWTSTSSANTDASHSPHAPPPGLMSSEPSMSHPPTSEVHDTAAASSRTGDTLTSIQNTDTPVTASHTPIS